MAAIDRHGQQLALNAQGLLTAPEVARDAHGRLTGWLSAGVNF
jgi:hypothetical protein